MEANSASMLYLLCVLLALAFYSAECDVTYDRKSLIIHGNRRLLFSGSIHYPRSTPQMWESLIQKAKDGGIDVIDTYVFWNVHEPSPGKYNFKGRHDIVRFIKVIQKAGLYVHLRIGPFICSEWNFGGFPVWLKFVPGISFRTDNEPFKAAMQKFTTKIVQMMKDEKLYESQGGPIILSQIENEYEPLRKAFGKSGNAYMTWAAKMAVGQNTGVPWVMCKDEGAPDPIINTCNGFYCDYFSPNKPYKPKMWTEAWTGWFSEFGRPIPNRPVQDLAFAVARFIQKGGSFVNYYMYHGGTNFGRTAGGPFITTSYDYDAPIDEYGIVRQRKHGHLRELHKAVKLCEKALLSADPTVTSLGNYEKAYVFSSKSGGCAAFLSNYNPRSAARVTFRQRHYNLPPWSMSILPDCKKEVFNTAKVTVQKSNVQMVPSNIKFHSWEKFNEDIPSDDHGTDVSVFGLLEQLNLTKDTTDYLWYTTSVDISSSESFLKGGHKPDITVQSAGPAMYLFVDGHYSGSEFGNREKRSFTFTKSLDLHAGRNRISLLSMAVGLPNIGRHFERWEIGILGPVILHGLDGGNRDISKQKWSYKVGLEGESLNLGSPRSKPSLWRQGSLLPNPLTWYKTSFDAPSGDEPMALDMGSMWKGQIWVNGHRIGRYWSTRVTKNICGKCSYANTYRQTKCQTGCGHVTQKWYHVPRSWLKPAGNQLVVFEEIGGDISKISLVQRRVVSVCADVSEDYSNTENLLNKHNQTETFDKPELRLECEAGKSISTIKFASFGTPLGECGNLKYGSCHASNSQDVLEKECIGKQKCSVTLSSSRFGADPCPSALKKLSVEAVCDINTTSTDQADSREPRL